MKLALTKLLTAAALLGLTQCTVPRLFHAEDDAGTGGQRGDGDGLSGELRLQGSLSPLTGKQKSKSFSLKGGLSTEGAPEPSQSSTWTLKNGKLDQRSGD